MFNEAALSDSLYERKLDLLGPKEIWEKAKAKARTARGSFELGFYPGLLTGAAGTGASFASAVPYISTANGVLGLIGSMGIGALFAGLTLGLGALGIYGLYRGYKKYIEPKLLKQ